MFLQAVDPNTAIISAMPSSLLEGKSDQAMLETLITMFDCKKIIGWCDDNDVKASLYIQKATILLSEDTVIDSRYREMFNDCYALMLEFEKASDLTHMKLVLG